MAIASSKRRIVTVAPETTRGTFLAPNATNDALPLLRGRPTFTIEPISVEREVLRLSYTRFPDIYPGVAKLEVQFTLELHGVPGNPQASYASPVWSDLMRACGFLEVSNAGSPSAFTEGAGTYTPVSYEPRMYTGFTGMTGSNGAPMRHGETVTVDYVTSGDIGPSNTFVLGDTYFDDDLMVIQEPTGSVAGSGAITLTTGASGSNKSTNAGTVVRNTQKIVVFKLRSDINLMETVSMEVYLDGKRVQGKGMMGNVELQLDYSDSIKAQFTMRGVREAYGDVSMPASPNEQHFVPPVFLGRDFRLSYFDGTNTRVYGKDSGAAYQLGAITQVRLSPGNEVVLRDNAFDASGITRAIINGRAGVGSFNPDEVLSGTPDNFDFITRFVAGSPFRLRAFIGSKVGDTGGSQYGAFPNSGQSIDVIAPGIVFTGMADQEREQVNIWDASFKLTGGDYDATPSGELPGNDNELTVIYR